MRIKPSLPLMPRSGGAGRAGDCAACGHSGARFFPSWAFPIFWVFRICPCLSLFKKTIKLFICLCWVSAVALRISLASRRLTRCIWKTRCCGTWASLLRCMWGLSSLTRTRTRVRCIGEWFLNQWTTREVPVLVRFVCPV